MTDSWWYLNCLTVCFLLGFRQRYYFSLMTNNITFIIINVSYIVKTSHLFLPSEPWDKSPGLFDTAVCSLTLLPSDIFLRCEQVAFSKLPLWCIWGCIWSDGQMLVLGLEELFSQRFNSSLRDHVGQGTHSNRGSSTQFPLSAAHPGNRNVTATLTAMNLTLCSESQINCKFQTVS